MNTVSENIVGYGQARLVKFIFAFCIQYIAILIFVYHCVGEHVIGKFSLSKLDIYDWWYYFLDGFVFGFLPLVCSSGLILRLHRKIEKIYRNLVGLLAASVAVGLSIGASSFIFLDSLKKMLGHTWAPYESLALFTPHLFIFLVFSMIACGTIVIGLNLNEIKQDVRLRSQAKKFRKA